MEGYSGTGSPIPYWYVWTVTNAHASWQNYMKEYAVGTSTTDLSRRKPSVQVITGQP